MGRNKRRRAAAAAVLALALAGCGGSTATSPAASGQSASGSASATASDKSSPAAARVGKPARDGKFEFVVTKVEPGKARVGDQYLNKKPQGQFVLVHLTVKNTGDAPQALSGDDQKLYAGNQEFSADSEAGAYIKGNDTLYNEINPGNTLKGIVVYDVPKGVKPTRLELHDSVLSGGVEVRL